jgi:hypothetical protein
MGKTTRPEYRGAWPRIRRAILDRDNHLCQIGSARCTIHATHVDHIIPVTQGGPWWEPDNLRASCRNCNLGRIDRKPQDAWKQSPTRIILVVGPPGAGKTTHVKTHAKPGDLIIDYDQIAGALGGELADPNHDPSAAQHIGGHMPSGNALHQATMSARNALIRSLRLGKTGVKKAWIISANPQAESMFPYHEVVVVDPGRDVVVGQVRNAGRPSNWVGLVDQWYRSRGRQATAPDSSREW